MRIEIEIPKEFEEHFKQDKFEDTLHRLNADAHLIAGNYEKETAIMLIKAFKESKPAYNVDAVVEQICGCDGCSGCCNCHEEERMMECEEYARVYDIVRKGGVHESKK